MILHGVKLTNNLLGAGYTNRPEEAQNGGYVVFSHVSLETHVKSNMLNFPF